MMIKGSTMMAMAVNYFKNFLVTSQLFYRELLSLYDFTSCIESC